MSPTPAAGRPKSGTYHRLMARFYDRVMTDYEAWIATRKRELFSDISGRVIEIGPGTGNNFPHLPAGIEWLGIEPNPFMHAALRGKASAAGITAQLHTGGAGMLPEADNSTDYVISTLVFCSVPDLPQTLAEIHRVLKPGGRLLFLEHVAAARGTRLRLLQNLLRPAWQVIGDGCCINRDTATAIRAAGFSTVHLEEFRVPRPPAPAWVSPHIIGRATK
jgi:ubiquinone/menaquinone biosynthesis C-methylase UbiE